MIYPEELFAPNIILQAFSTHSDNYELLLSVWKYSIWFSEKWQVIDTENTQDVNTMGTGLQQFVFIQFFFSKNCFVFSCLKVL